MGHVSVLGANLSPTSLCLEVLSKRAGDSQGVWSGASKKRFWCTFEASSSDVPEIQALLAALEESDSAWASLLSTVYSHL